MNFKPKRIYETFEFALLSLSNFIRTKFGYSPWPKDVPQAKLISWENWKRHLCEIGNKPGNRILEIGSREVTGISCARQEFNHAEYVGFDFHPGNNVDLVGDVHKLSSYFKKGEKFDLIYSSACFEHFAMPWIAAIEIAKMLKVGGLVFIETHFAFSSHERPWHFFHFTDLGLRALFSPALGFECIEAGFSNPIVGRFSMHAAKAIRNQKIKRMYCHAEYLGRKIKEIEGFQWEGLDVRQVVGDSRYPETTVLG